MRKKEIQKLYRLEPEMGSRGKIKEVPVYIGGYYKLEDNEASYKKVAVRLLAIMLAMILLFVVAALPDPQGLRQMYIALPYVSLFLPYVFTVVGCFVIFGVKQEMNEVQYTDGVKRIIKNSIVARVMTVMVAIAEIAFVAFNSKDCKIEEELLLFACVAAMFFLNEMKYRYINRVNDRMNYRKQNIVVEE